MAKKGLNLPKEMTFTGPALVWKRAIAFLADFLIINSIIFFPFRKVIQNEIPDMESYSEAYNFLISNQGYATRLTVISVIMSLLSIMYFALIENKAKQTPGKIFMNISVESETKNLTFIQCAARSLFLIPAFPFFLLWL